VSSSTRDLGQLGINVKFGCRSTRNVGQLGMAVNSEWRSTRNVGQLGVQGVGSNDGGGVVAGVVVCVPAGAVVGETVGGASA